LPLQLSKHHQATAQVCLKTKGKIPAERGIRRYIIALPTFDYWKIISLFDFGLVHALIPELN
jgi:hypothetical protein